MLIQILPLLTLLQSLEMALSTPDTKLILPTVLSTPDLLPKIPNEDNDVLAIRPIATNRIYDIKFTTKLVTLRKSLNVKAYIKYFNEIIALWSSFYMENQLRNMEEYEYTPAIVDKRNPECRDLQSLIMEDIKAISDSINANFNNQPTPINHYKENRSKRDLQNLITTNPTLSRLIMKPIEPQQSTTGQIMNPNKTLTPISHMNNKKQKRSITSTILKMMGAYMAKQGIKRLASESKTNTKYGLLPIGGTILSYAFGLAKSKDVKLNTNKLNLLSDQFINLQQKHKSLINFANLTKIIIEEMVQIITKNDKKIIELFEITDEQRKIHSRTILCLQLYTESAFLLDTVRTVMNNFLMADTLIPKGNKNLFSERELNNLLSHEPDYRVATGKRNLWDYSLFNLIKQGDEWIYETQVPLTNLPPFSIYKISPFPVFPKSNNGPALTVNIEPNTIVTLSKDDKYFVDNINPETCIFSDTQGVCPGPIGLIDTDFGDCSVSIMLFDPKQLFKNCKFSIYKDHFPRITTSMGKFIISITKRHEFVKSCGNQLSSLTIVP